LLLIEVSVDLHSHGPIILIDQKGGNPEDKDKCYEANHDEMAKIEEIISDPAKYGTHGPSLSFPSKPSFFMKSSAYHRAMASLDSAMSSCLVIIVMRPSW